MKTKKISSRFDMLFEQTYRNEFVKTGIAKLKEANDLNKIVGYFNLKPDNNLENIIRNKAFEENLFLILRMGLDTIFENESHDKKNSVRLYTEIPNEQLEKIINLFPKFLEQNPGRNIFICVETLSPPSIKLILIHDTYNDLLNFERNLIHGYFADEKNISAFLKSAMEQEQSEAKKIILD